MDVFYRYSPNHNERPCEPVSLLVMHYTGMESGDAALAHLCDPASGVSAHYLVEEDGSVFQLVEEDRRAWHAGVGYWDGVSNVNDVSIGIEIVNPGHEHGYRPFPPAQIDAVTALSRDIMERHEIAPHHVVAHSDLAPARKQDPGELFPWETLAARGIGVWPDASTAPHQAASSDAETMLATLGYGVNISGTPEECIIAFQRRFCPDNITGAWDDATLRTCQKILHLCNK